MSYRLLWLSLGILTGDVSAQTRDLLMHIWSKEDGYPRILLPLAEQERCMPELYLALKKAALPLPAPIRSMLESCYQKNAIFNLAINGQLQELARAFEQVQLQGLLLKGGAFISMGFWRDPGRRVTSDIDLYVDPKDIDKTCTLLESLGYQVIEAAEGFHDCRQYRRDRAGASIELHLSLAPKQLEYLLPSGRMLQTAQPGRFGKALLVPSTTELYWHILVHSTIQHVYPKLRDLIDLAEMARRFDNAEIDYAEIDRRIETSTLKSALNTAREAALALANGAIQSPVAYRIAAQLRALPRDFLWYGGLTVAGFFAYERLGARLNALQDWLWCSDGEYARWRTQWLGKFEMNWLVRWLVRGKRLIQLPVGIICYAYAFLIVSWEELSSRRGNRQVHPTA